MNKNIINPNQSLEGNFFLASHSVIIETYQDFSGADVASYAVEIELLLASHDGLRHELQTAF